MTFQSYRGLAFPHPLSEPTEQLVILDTLRSNTLLKPNCFNKARNYATNYQTTFMARRTHVILLVFLSLYKVQKHTTENLFLLKCEVHNALPADFLP